MNAISPPVTSSSLIDYDLSNIGFPIDPDVRKLVKNMSLEEKIGQMMQMDISAILEDSDQSLDLNMTVRALQGNYILKK